MPRPAEFRIEADRRFPIRERQEAEERAAFFQARTRHYDARNHRYHEGYVQPSGLGLTIEDFPGTRTVEVVIPIDIDPPKGGHGPRPGQPGMGPRPDKPGHGPGEPGKPGPVLKSGGIPTGGPIGKPQSPIQQIDVVDIPEHVQDYAWRISRREDDFSFEKVQVVEWSEVQGVPTPSGAPYRFSLAVPGPGIYDISIRQRDARGNTVSEREASYDLRDFLVVSMGDSYSAGQGNPDIPGAPKQDSAWYDVFLPSLGFVASLAGGAILAPLAYKFGKEALDNAWEMIKQQWATAARGGGWSIDMDPEPVWLEPEAYRSLRSGTAVAAGSLENPAEGQLITFLTFARTGAEIFDGLLGPRTSDGVPKDGWIGNKGELEEMEETLTRAGRTEIDALVISVGVNDLGFASTLTRLVADDRIGLLGGEGSDTGNREKTLQRAEQKLDSGEIRGAFEALRRRLEESPLTIHRVYLLEYPTAIFDRADGQPGTGCGIFSSNFDLDMDQRDAEVTKHLGERLNAEIRSVAREFDWVYVGNIDAGFSGHGYCMGDDSFYRTASESIIIQGDSEGTMHPNAAGHEVVAEHVARALQRNMVAAAHAPEGVETAAEAWTVGEVREKWQPVRFGQDYESAPVVIAAMQTARGMDPALVRIRNVSEGGCEMRIEEERRGEAHPNAEDVGFVAVRPGLVRDRRSGEIVGEAGFVNADQPDPDLWHKVAFDERIDGDVVVLMQVMSANGHHPVHVRLRDVGAAGDGERSFRFKLEEWAGMDNTHARERLGYLVLRAGRHSLPGADIVAGHEDGVDAGWRQGVDFEASPGGVPVVLSQCQTFNGHDPVVTRQRDIGERSFDVRLQEGRQGGGHTEERVGYLALEAA